MSPEIITWIWAGAGLAMILAELVVPGAVLGFLGASALLVSGLRAIGLIESWPASLTTWFILSVGMVVGLRGLVTRWIAPERSISSTDEDLEVFGREVEVLSEVSATGEDGRVRFRGTTWKARSIRGVLPPGVAARIVDRDNLVFVVEPVHALPPQKEASSSEASSDDESKK